MVLVSQVKITLTKRGKCESLLVQQGLSSEGYLIRKVLCSNLAFALVRGISWKEKVVEGGIEKTNTVLMAT